MARPTPALVVLLLALSLTGCDDGADHAAPPSPAPSPSTATVQGHPGRYAGPLTTTVRHDPPGLVLAPPDPDVRPDVPWADALASCFEGPIRCVATGAAEVVLAEVDGPGNAVIGGRTLFDHALTYVVTWAPSACHTRAADRCRVVNLVTAQRRNEVAAGTVLYAFEMAAEPTA